MDITKGPEHNKSSLFPIPEQTTGSVRKVKLPSTPRCVSAYAEQVAQHQSKHCCGVYTSFKMRKKYLEKDLGLSSNN